MKSALVLAAFLAIAAVPAAEARSFETIRSFNAIGLCAHPNSLPFASKAGDPPGFQIEMGNAIAERLGVKLKANWVLTVYQIRAADCDMILDTIADREAQEETNLRISKPYYRAEVAIAVPVGSPITSLEGLDAHTKVGVQVGSVAAMVLSQRHIGTSTFGFEEDSLEALANHEIDAATVTQTSAGYYNLKHPDRAVRLIQFAAADPRLAWNVAIGMVRPDDELRRKVDEALDALGADGTIARIYQRYGIALEPPQ